ncbi:MAG: DUF4331 family protein [Chitinophagales bacterium]
MKVTNFLTRFTLWAVLLTCLGYTALEASSHREAPLIANDPLADNTDVYAFVSPDDPETVTIIANYIPGQLPHGGPNYYNFGENIRYEIHVDNDAGTAGDDIIYRFTFDQTNEDGTTFFNIRLGAQNLKTTYTLERSTDGGTSFSTVVTNGVVPPNNIGPRSIQTGVGLGAQDYESVIKDAITTSSTGEKVFCGPADDPFYVDLGGIFDLGDAPRLDSPGSVDGLACFNVHSIALQIPISTLQKDGKNASEAANILDGDFVIGVWASASRPKIRTLNGDGTVTVDGSQGWVQVSRLGMPLTNEAVIAIQDKDQWNADTPYTEDPANFEYFYNPELALYMDDDQFGAAVPAFNPLRIQTNSLGAFDFSNGADGLFGLKGSPALDGTALAEAAFGGLLLPKAGAPRSVDLLPIFFTGAPNIRPYQLATGKEGDPLAAGKPFINNFLPSLGDMLRLNMAVPPTDRNSPDFSSLGLVQAAVSGLLDPRFNTTSDLEFIPNMDGFPNGRRLEDDVTRIELQAVSGIVLAAIGLWYDDFDGENPVTTDLLNVYTYTTGIEQNDKSLKSAFPYVASPFIGTGACGGTEIINPTDCDISIDQLGGSNFDVYNLTLSGAAPFTVSFVERSGPVSFRNRNNTVRLSVGLGASFTIMVTDANGCSATVSGGIGGDLVSVSLVGTTVESAPGVGDGALDISVSGGDGDYEYLWSNGETTQDISGLASGTYTVEITDGEYSTTKSFFVPVAGSNGGGGTGRVRGRRGKAADVADNTFLQVSPNPASFSANVQFNVEETQTVSLEVYTMSGQRLGVLFNGQVESEYSYNIPVDVTELPAGVYIARLNDANGNTITHHKLVVSK